MQFLLFSLVFITISVLVLAITDMETVYEWKYIDYVWDSEVMKQRAIETGDYDYSQIVPMDVDKAPDGRVFVTFLGTWGTPAVLGTVSDKRGPSGPLVKPYPDWSYYGQGDCDLIRNVYRIAIDKCQRLWVLDNGFLETESPYACERLNCGAQLHVFDLKTDRLIDRIKIPDYYARGSSDFFLLATPIIETYGEKCEDTTVYMADTFGFGLIIWNNGEWSRLEDSRFQPDQNAENVTSGGDTVTWSGAGIVTMDISPETYPGEPRELHFHSLASFGLHSAYTADLKNTNDATTVNFVDADNVLSSQAAGVAFSSEGTFFMGLTEDSSIACWNRYRPLERENIETVAQDRDRLVYLNGMKVIRGQTSDDDELWVLSNRFVSWTSGNIDHKENNFRVLKKSVKQLTDGTACE